MAKAQARRDEYARDWIGKPVKHAARHFGVGNRTIVRWRKQLGLRIPRAL